MIVQFIQVKMTAYYNIPRNEIIINSSQQ